MLFGENVDSDIMRETNKLGHSLLNPNASSADLTEPEKIISDEEARKQK